jgi:hypothetical protein
MMAHRRNVKNTEAHVNGPQKEHDRNHGNVPTGELHAARSTPITPCRGLLKWIAGNPETKGKSPGECLLRPPSAYGKRQNAPRGRRTVLFALTG